MELIASRGKLNGDPMNFPVIEKGVSLAMGSSYAKGIFAHRLGPGETQDSSKDMYSRMTQEVPDGYEPSMDLYLAWCNSLVRDSKHLMGRVYFKREGRDYLFTGGRNTFQIYALDNPDETE